jgi:hypothetical protein
MKNKTFIFIFSVTLFFANTSLANQKWMIDIKSDFNIDINTLPKVKSVTVYVDGQKMLQTENLKNYLSGEYIQTNIANKKVELIFTLTDNTQYTVSQVLEHNLLVGFEFVFKKQDTTFSELNCGLGGGNL